MMASAQQMGANKRAEVPSAAYAVDFALSTPSVELESPQSAIVSGWLVEQESGKLTDKPYRITVSLSGGPARFQSSNNFPPMAGLGEARFADRQGPKMVKRNGEIAALEIALLGRVGRPLSEEGSGLRYYRGAHTQAVVTVDLGEAYEASRLNYWVTGIDGQMSVQDCADIARDASSPCAGSYADRVTILSDSANWMITPENPDRVMSITNRLFPKFQDRNNNGRPDVPEDMRLPLLDSNSSAKVSHFGSVGSKFSFRFDDFGKPLDGGESDQYPFDAPQVSIGLGSRITFDLREKAPEVQAVSADLVQISGTVFADENRNGVRDDGENAAATQEVRVFEAASYGQSGPLASVAVGDDGRYLIDNLHAGIEYRVEALVKPQPEVTEVGKLRAIRLIKRVTPERGVVNQLDFAAWPRELGEEKMQRSDLLLPDLMPYPVAPSVGDGEPAWNDAMSLAYPTIKDWAIDTKSFPGRVFIRFGTTAFNRGAGPLHMVGGPQQGGQQIVYQRMYAKDGSFQDRLAGLFVYHPGHDHIHVDGFEAYSLRDIETDRILAGSGKVSFCLANIDWGDATRQFAEHDQVALAFSGWECDQVEQSINTGYGDYYEPHLPYQWIDVTSVPSGQYWLEVRVDPSDVLLESDESNNAVRIKIDLTNPLH